MRLFSGALFAGRQFVGKLFRGAVVTPPEPPISGGGGGYLYNDISAHRHRYEKKQYPAKTDKAKAKAVDAKKRVNPVDLPIASVNSEAEITALFESRALQAFLAKQQQIANQIIADELEEEELAMCLMLM